MITADDIAEALAGLGVGPDDTVFAHAGLQGAMRVRGETAEQKLETVLEGFLRATGSGALIMPTFTYSFCEGRPFDLAETPSTVGALGERFRMMPGVRRTADPIFSCAVHGKLPEVWERRLFEVNDTDCFGPESVFAYLLESRARLVFFGIGFGYCTFVHHVEQRLGVPYRRFKDFSGTIDAGSGAVETTARYLVRELEPGSESFFEPLGDALIARGSAARVTLPGGPSIMAVPAEEVEPEAGRQLSSNPDFLISRGHDQPGPDRSRQGVAR